MPVLISFYTVASKYNCMQQFSKLVEKDAVKGLPLCIKNVFYASLMHEICGGLRVLPRVLSKAKMDKSV